MSEEYFLSSANATPPQDDPVDAPVQEEEPPGCAASLGVSPLLATILIATTAAQYYATSVLGTYQYYGLDLSPQQTTLFWMYISWIEWGSPAVGWLADFLSVFGERRRPAMALGTVMNVACWTLAYCLLEHLPFGGIVGLFLVQTFGQMLVSIPLNGIVVETAVSLKIPGMSPRAVVGKVQARAMLLRTVGSLVGAALQTGVLKAVKAREALLLAPVLYTVTLGFVLFLRWAPQTEAQEAYAAMSLPQRGLQTIERIRTAALRLCAPEEKQHRKAVFGFFAVLVFVFIYNAMPDASVMYSQFTADKFYFPEWYYSLTSAIGLLGSIAGCEFYRWVLAPRNQFVVFVAGGLCAALAFTTKLMLATGFSHDTLHVSNEAFVAIDNFIVSFFTRIAFMPVLHVAAERCPQGFEAFVVELFSTAAIGGSSVAAVTTAHMATRLGITKHYWDPLWKLLAACAACKLLPLLLAFFLPAPPEEDDVVMCDEGSSDGDSLETAPILQ